ncbi:MAG: CCA tRNA nucleotidyltransferase [Bdellovibrionales bacterium]
MFQIEEKLSQNSQWKEVQNILKKLSNKGYQAVLAGGGVRDSLMGLKPKDFDIATSAKPQEILKLFPQAIDKWSHYGNVLIPLKTKGHVDVTSFRKEFSYTDGRHPDKIEYSSMKEDAQRRDFTINALFYDAEKNKIIDFVGGLGDLKNKTLKTVGESSKRFNEDHLRILRALRFAHQFQFSLDQKTKEALFLCSKKLNQISRERINSEILKMLGAGNIGKGLALLEDYEILKIALSLPNNAFKPAFLFWNQKFSFYQDPAYLWCIVGLPYFQEATLFKKYLENLKRPSSEVQKSMSYFKSFQVLTTSQNTVHKIKSLHPYFEQVRELHALWCKSYQIQDDHLETVIEKFYKIGKWPLPLITSSDLLKEARLFPKEKWSYFLNQAFDLQLEFPEKKKSQILKELKKKI